MRKNVKYEDDRCFDYASIWVFYQPTNNRYEIFESIVGARLGVVLLEEGPGWVFLSECCYFMQQDLISIAELCQDLNEERT